MYYLATLAFMVYCFAYNETVSKYWQVSKCASKCVIRVSQIVLLSITAKAAIASPYLPFVFRHTATLLQVKAIFRRNPKGVIAKLVVW